MSRDAEWAERMVALMRANPDRHHCSPRDSRWWRTLIRWRCPECGSKWRLVGYNEWSARSDLE